MNEQTSLKDKFELRYRMILIFDLIVYGNLLKYKSTIKKIIYQSCDFFHIREFVAMPNFSICPSISTSFLLLILFLLCLLSFSYFSLWTYFSFCFRNYFYWFLWSEIYKRLLNNYSSFFFLFFVIVSISLSIKSVLFYNFYISCF
jgi:hypothetical protein